MKPDWLKEMEIQRRLKKCINCKHKGEVVGFTNNAGKGIGRIQIYRCKKHPNIEFHEREYACEDYER